VGASGVGQRGLEPGVGYAAVVGHDVEEVAEALFKRGAAQRRQGRVAAQVRVHVIVIDDVVAVVAIGSEDRIQVKGVHPQIGQVGQVLHNARQVAAVKIPPWPGSHGWAAGPKGPLAPDDRHRQIRRRGTLLAGSPSAKRSGKIW